MKAYAYIYVLIFFSVFILIEVIAAIRILSRELPAMKRVRITMRINIILLCTGLLMLGVVVLFDVNFVLYKSPVPHSKWKEITLRDFRGLKRPGQTLDGSGEFAFIVSETRVKRTGNSVEVSVWFHPARSYVFNSSLEDDKLLRHEMYHFHIREYCARLLRKRISGMPASDAGTRLLEAEAEFSRLEKQLQAQYDDESYHSYVSARQIEWEKKVDSLLLDLKTYEGTTVQLK